MRNWTYLEKNRRCSDVQSERWKRWIRSTRVIDALFASDFIWISEYRILEIRYARLYVLQSDKYHHKEYNKYNIKQKW